MTNRKSKIGNPKSPDPRHARLMEEIDRLYRRYNGLPPPDMGRTAKALSGFLRANPRWPVETIQRAMRNRFASKNINPSEPPWAWLRYLPNYIADPLDEYKRPMRGKGDEIFAWWEAELSKIETRK
jgi:hypothetical protein